MMLQVMRSTSSIAGLSGLGQGIGLLFSFVIARLYLPHEFGVLSVITSLTVIAATVSTGRFEQAIPLVSQAREAAALIRLALLTGTLVCAGGGLVLLLVPGLLPTEFDTSLLVLAIVIVLLLSLFQTATLLLIRLRRFLVLGVARLLYPSVTGLLQVIFGIFHPVALSLVIGQVVGLMGCVLVVVPLTKRHLLAGRKWHERLWVLAKRHRLFPLYNAGATFFNVAGLMLPTALIAAIYSPQEAGLYALAFKLTDAPNQVGGQALGYVFFSDASRLSRRAKSDVAGYALRISGFVVLVCAVPYTIAAVYAEEISSLLFGETWRGVGSYMAIMAPASLATLSILHTTNFSVIHKEGVGLTWTLVNLFVGLGVFALAWTLVWSPLTAIAAFAAARVGSMCVRLVLWRWVQTAPQPDASNA